MVSPLGITVKDSWAALLQGKSGLVNGKGLYEWLGRQELAVAPVPREFEAGRWKSQVIDCQFQARRQSLEQLRLGCLQRSSRAFRPGLGDRRQDADCNFPFTQGTNIAVMAGNTTKTTDFVVEATKKGFGNINRLAILHMLGNIPTANVSIKFGLEGPSNTTSTACAAGLSAIGDAYRLIQLGLADAMLAGGVEDALNPANVFASLRLQALNGACPEPASLASCPFDEKRAGFVIGEGGAAVVLEDLAHAQRRKATILAEIVGFGQTCNKEFVKSADAYHFTKPLPCGRQSARAMELALQEAGSFGLLAGIDLEEVGFVNCHATSTAVGDAAEAQAIHRLF